MVGAQAPPPPPASGAWREGDPVGGRRFVDLGPLRLERGGLDLHFFNERGVYAGAECSVHTRKDAKRQQAGRIVLGQNGSDGSGIILPGFRAL